MMKPKFQSSSPRPVDHGRDQVVGDKLAAGHAAPDLGAQLGVVLDVPAEDVADTDVFQLKGFGQELGLGALAAALDAHDDVLAHPAPAFMRRS